MSRCVVPTSNLRQQRQEQAIEPEELNRYDHVHNQQNQNHRVPMSKCEEVAELTWENGQLAMHGLGGILPNAQTKPRWGRAGDTLESIVHQATHHWQNQNLIMQSHDQNQQTKNIGMCGVLEWGEPSAMKQQMVPPPPPPPPTTTCSEGAEVLAKKRMRSESEPQYGGKAAMFSKSSIREDERSACASASATFCRDNDTTILTWPSFDESSRSFKSKTTCDDDSACQGASENKDEEHETKGYNSSRRSRAAAVHNQSERRRRDRINQKMKALQRMVPNASKTDKASMLDEVINYLKQLQTQVELMSNARNMGAPQMMMPLGMQQHIQMSLLARMGMGVGLGMGMGMYDVNALARAQSLASTQLTNPTTAPPFLPPPFTVPSTAAPPPANPDACRTSAAITPAATTSTSSVPFTDPYTAFLTQSMNMEFFNKMAALHRQQSNQSGSKLNLQGNFMQGQRE